MWTVPGGGAPFQPQMTVSQRKPGFFERVGIGWRLTKVSFGVLRKDKSLLLLPLLSFMIIAVSWVVFIISIFFMVFPTGTFNIALFLVGVFFLYFLTYFITAFFAAAVMGAAMIRLNGGVGSAGEGLRVAARNVGRILGWAILSATVGVILRAIAERFGIIGRIIAGGASIAWGILTYLVIPALIFERLGPWSAVKRSGRLIRETWGEAAGGYFTMGAIFVLLGLLGVPIFLAGVAIGSFTAIVVFGIAAIVYWLILALFASTAQSILVTALYRYATTGQVAEGWPAGMMAPR